MKKDVLNRYERDAGGSILIDVAADKVEDLYSDFDKSAPYIRRDLDQDLVDYLIDCARELGNEPFTISFTLVNPPDDTGLSRIRGSINNFFLYLVEIERQKVRQMLRRSLILFCIGIAILFISVWVNRWLGSERTVVAYVFSEGLIVAAWVSLWESLATFLIEWFPRLRNIKLYQRLASVRPVFRSGPETMANGDMGFQSVAPPDRE
ncbi:MAG: hypothetical protein KKC76_15525 [Proteobacteria bacterium]|nr:hypothetical protein [Pseudomonadota bacterium]MBU4294518.1 hypothetical protein [Pseudomonadota bacterium]MCG2747054.1 hypothetical protein [Desulfobulbaceae bacterium]